MQGIFETSSSTFEGKFYIEPLTAEIYAAHSLNFGGTHNPDDAENIAAIQGGQADARWHWLSWGYEDAETEDPRKMTFVEHTVAWVDGDTIFIPSDAQGGVREFVPSGPVSEDGAHWSEISSGKPAIVGLPGAPLAVFA